MRNSTMFLSAIVLATISLSGCTTTARLQRDTGDIIAANARAAARLESTIDGLDDTIKISRERLGVISRASEKITNGVDRLEYLFGEYESEVGRLLDEIDRIRTEAKVEGETDKETN